MNLKTLSLALATAVSSPAFAQETEPTFSFECIAQGYDGEYKAVFETAEPMLIVTPRGYLPNRLGSTVSMHSEIVDPHHFLTDAETLPNMIFVNDTVAGMSNMTEEALEVLAAENAEVNKAIDAMERSLDWGVEIPSCDASVA